MTLRQTLVLGTIFAALFTTTTVAQIADGFDLRLRDSTRIGENHVGIQGGAATAIQFDVREDAIVALFAARATAVGVPDLDTVLLLDVRAMRAGDIYAMQLRVPQIQGEFVLKAFMLVGDQLAQSDPLTVLIR